MDDDVHSADRLDDGIPRAKVDWDHLRPCGESGRSRPGRTTARTWWPARRARRTTAPPINPLAPRTAIFTGTGQPRPPKTVPPPPARPAYVHDACTSPPYVARPAVP